MNIVIIGQGAIGLLWYHHILKLINNNCDYQKTTLRLLSSQHSPLKDSRFYKESIPLEHYSFTDHDGEVHIGELNYANSDSIQKADVIMLCLKSFQVSSALKSISRLMKKHTSIILSHNGMGTLTEIPDDIKKERNIYALLTTHGCLRSSPLVIKHTGIGVSDIGLVSGKTKIEEQQSLTELLNSALAPVSFHQRIKQKQWLKLAINCVINPLSAINNVKNGQINNSEFREEVSAILTEVSVVAKAENIVLNVEELIKTVNTVAKATAKNSSSMRCDIQANRKSEIDYINGYIHRLGLKHNIATDKNTALWQSVKKLNSYS